MLGGPAFLLGSWGPCPSLRSPWAPTSPDPHPVLLERWVRNLPCGPQGRPGASAWWPGPAGWPPGLQEKETVWGQCPSGGPPAPKPPTPRPPPGPPPSCPSGSLLPPQSPGPWHGRVCPPPNHIWFLLGSPRMPPPAAPLSWGRWAGGLGVIRNTPGQGRRRRERGPWPVINSNTMTPSPHHSLWIPSSVSKTCSFSNQGRAAPPAPLPPHLVCPPFLRSPSPAGPGGPGGRCNHTFPLGVRPLLLGLAFPCLVASGKRLDLLEQRE